MKDLLIVLGAFGLVALMGQVFGPNLLTLAFGLALIWAVQDALMSQRISEAKVPKPGSEPIRKRLAAIHHPLILLTVVVLSTPIIVPFYRDAPTANILGVNALVGFVAGAASGGSKVWRGVVGAVLTIPWTANRRAIDVEDRIVRRGAAVVRECHMVDPREHEIRRAPEPTGPAGDLVQRESPTRRDGRRDRVVGARVGLFSSAATRITHLVPHRGLQGPCDRHVLRRRFANGGHGAGD